MRTPTFQTARVAITLCLLLVLSACVALLFWGVSRELYYQDEMRLLLTGLAKVFAPHIAIVAGASLAAKPGSTRHPSAQMLLTAAAAVLLWSGIVVGRVALFVLDEGPGDTVAELQKYLQETPSAFGFLLTGILAFFFAKQE